MPDLSVHDQLANFQSDEITTPELAVDRQIKQGQVADPPHALEMKAGGPDLLRLEGRFGTDEAALVPGHGGPGMREWDARRFISHSASPEPRDCGSRGKRPGGVRWPEAEWRLSGVQRAEADIAGGQVEPLLSPQK
jgi:hypothetical protein